MIFYDDFRELVETAVKNHISLDPCLEQEDFEYEIENVSNALRRDLMYRGVIIVEREEGR